MRMLVSFLLLIFLFLGGCAQLSQINFPTIGFNNAPIEQIIPQRVNVPQEELAADVKAVLAGLIYQMYMAPGMPKEIVFVSGGEHQLYDPTFDYSGFAIRNIDIVTHEMIGNDRVRLGGVIHFEDPVYRRTAVRYLARYQVTRDRVLIEESSINPIQPTFPKIVTFYVPEEAFTGVNTRSFNDFYSWYTFAAQNAVNMDPTAAEVAERQRWEQMSMIDKIRNPRVVSPSRYIVMVFSLDRILGNGSLNINFADSSRSCPTTSHESVTMIDDRGWKIGMVGAELAIDDWSNQVFINVGYAPGGDFRLFSGYPMLVGSFTTTKNYTTVSDSEYTAGPLEKGQRFLNPRQRDDARLIQRRLSEFGFYRMEVDGLFGPGSLSALQAFKQRKGLGDNANWDMMTQMELFAGSGL